MTLVHGNTAPEDFPRRILVAATGLYPQVLTETLYALAVQQRPAFQPTEIHVISTSEGCERVRLMLLSDDERQLRRLCEDYRLPLPQLREDQIHTIVGPDGQVLDDIRTPEDNISAADCITRLVATLCDDPEAAVHVSIAGGRKTMSYYLGYALSLFGRSQDRMSHVLVSSPFETLPTFFYPTPRSRILQGRNDTPLDAAKAQVQLADIPFVRMRDDVTALIRSPEASFSRAVNAAAALRRPPELMLDGRGGVIVCDGQEVELSEKLFLIYAWFVALRLSASPKEQRVVRPSLKGSGAEFFHTVADRLQATFATQTWRHDPDQLRKLESVQAAQFVSEKLSRIQEALQDRLFANTLVDRFAIRSIKLGRGRAVAWELPLAKHQIVVRG
ncbi:TIGR02584 family CRISPR-associated protein [Ahniella affigens]|uniref:TIGR02584 family CRISPR-associated protein n=1 Tax=Ahniella affigens TaxID=2021234 RepID=A0A2P1PTQ4_9GAMM|nr:CRISPR-associated ring nuclease Csm6 [Ahniella affigens]AVP98224.1 TIGR02584 family CRISPR-associated protein [Ahniella affigens]